tara:strand:- start:12701 stop:13873 length:1173 start_codon:yes stop_codon:yes gene_type:complete
MPVCRKAALKRRKHATEEVREAYAQKKSHYHAKQIFSLHYQQHIHSWDEMTDLSKAMREWLKQHVQIFSLDTLTEQRSEDGTMKFLWQLPDKKTVESVIIPATGNDAHITEEGNQFRGTKNEAALKPDNWDRMTICISSQVGCAMACKFCLTGVQGFDRQLEVHEIVTQVAQLARTYPLSNIVFMGMGEPLHNPDAVIKACKIFRDDAGLSFSRRRVTVSTSGLVPQIDRLREETDVTLAISLSGTHDPQREEIMPVNKKWPLNELLDACRRFQGNGKVWITFEYVMLKDVNDTLEDAARLADILEGIRAKVNLIPFNPFPGSIYDRSDPEQVQRFKNALIEKGVFTSVRISRGQDIFAACGQLRSAFGTARGTEKHAPSLQSPPQQKNH